MKRSKTISLLLMGTLAAGSAGCSDDAGDEAFRAFSSAAECSASGLFSSEECSRYEAEALARTPHFDSREDCEKNFGANACRQDEAAVAQTSAGPEASSNSTGRTGHYRSGWSPMFWGFMAGRYLGNNSMMSGSQGLYGKPGGTSSFRTATGDIVTPDSKGNITPSSKMRQNLGFSAKPSMVRSAPSGKGGFSGFGGGGS